jgi:hypothetical protein
MQSKAPTVQAYLNSLPEDRRAALSSVRDVILKNLDASYEEGMQYGVIGYYVPHRVYPKGYHCDPQATSAFRRPRLTEELHVTLLDVGVLRMRGRQFRQSACPMVP